MILKHHHMGIRTYLKINCILLKIKRLKKTDLLIRIAIAKSKSRLSINQGKSIKTPLLIKS